MNCITHAVMCIQLFALQANLFTKHLCNKLHVAYIFHLLITFVILRLVLIFYANMLADIVNNYFQVKATIFGGFQLVEVCAFAIIGSHYATDLAITPAPSPGAVDMPDSEG